MTLQDKSENLISGAEALMRALVDEGVDVIFGYPGGSIIPIYDALYDYKDKLHHILTRHEQGAAHAAEGYARATGRVGVCFATSGPGATNLVTGIADAMLDSVPVVFITGQVGTSMLGSDAFQETDVIGVTIPITKWNYQVTKADEIPEVIARAFRIASSGRPGPVVIDVTKDAQVSKTTYKAAALEDEEIQFAPQNEQLEEAAELINSAEKPLIFAGHGIHIAHAEEEFKQFVEKTGIPVGFTFHGLSTLPYSHPLNMGMLGMHGNYGLNMLSNEADLVIAIGMRFDDRVTMKLSGYLSKAKIIHIEIDPAEIDKNVKIDVPLVMDAKTAITSLMPLVEQKSHSEWLAEFAVYTAIEQEKVTEGAIHPTTEQLRMTEVVHRVSELTNGEALVVTDVGQHQMAAAKYYDFKRSDSFISSGGLGTMGFGLPAALGAAFAKQDRPLLLFIGDGGFQMTIQELATIAEHKLPVKVILLNNSFLGMVRQWQDLFYHKRYSSVEMHNPDFVAISRGFGLASEKVSDRAGLDAALERMLASKEGFVLEVEVEKEDAIFPMIPAGASVTDIRLE